MIVEHSGVVADAELAAASADGLSEGEIVETVVNVAVNKFTNHLSHVADTDIDFPGRQTTPPPDRRARRANPRRAACARIGDLQ